MPAIATDQPTAAFLTREELSYLRNRLLSPKNPRPNLISALAVEAKLNFETICRLTLSCFDFRYRLIYGVCDDFTPLSGDNEMLREGNTEVIGDFDIETFIAFGEWMKKRECRDGGIYGVLLCENDARCGLDDHLTPSLINDEFRALLCDDHPSAERYSASVSLFNESYFANFTF